MTPIEPLPCQSVLKASVVTTKQIALVARTFKEGDYNTVNRELGFCVLENNSETALIGKPTLDTVGFVSDFEMIGFAGHRH